MLFYSVYMVPTMESFYKAYHSYKGKDQESIKKLINNHGMWGALDPDDYKWHDDDDPKVQPNNKPPFHITLAHFRELEELKDTHGFYDEVRTCAHGHHDRRKKRNHPLQLKKSCWSKEICDSKCLEIYLKNQENHDDDGQCRFIADNILGANLKLRQYLDVVAHDTNKLHVSFYNSHCNESNTNDAISFLSNIYWCLAVVEYDNKGNKDDNKYLYIVDRQKHEIYV